MNSITKHKLFYSNDIKSERNLDNEQLLIIDEFNKKKYLNEIQFEYVNCICESKEFVLIAKKDRYRINQDTVICKDCGLVQSNPRMTKDYYKWFYSSDYYRELYSPKLLANNDNDYMKIVNGYKSRYDFIKKFISKDDEILEIGCGAGWNLYNFFNKGYKIYGYDYGVNLVEYGKSKGLNLKTGDIDDIKEKNVNFILLAHVFEHFLEPMKELEKIKRILDDKGFLYIEVPDTDKFGIGSLQNAHTYYFTKNTLLYFVGTLGLKMIAFSRNLPGNSIGMILEKSNTINDISLIDNEYKRMINLIQKYDKKQYIRSFLEKLRVFKTLDKIRKSFL